MMHSQQNVETQSLVAAACVLVWHVIYVCALVGCNKNNIKTHDTWIKNITITCTCMDQCVSCKVTTTWCGTLKTLYTGALSFLMSIVCQFFANDQPDALFYIFIYYISLHVSSITVLIIRRLNCINTSSKQLRWSRGSMLAFSTQVRGFKSGQSRRIFKGEKILSTPSFGGEVKPSVPCHRFTACKRTLECIADVGF